MSSTAAEARSNLGPWSTTRQHGHAQAAKQATAALVNLREVTAVQVSACMESPYTAWPDAETAREALHASLAAHGVEMTTAILDALDSGIAAGVAANERRLESARQQAERQAEADRLAAEAAEQRRLEEQHAWAKHERESEAAQARKWAAWESERAGYEAWRATQATQGGAETQGAAAAARPRSAARAS